jgi:hypothetical protein
MPAYYSRLFSIKAMGMPQKEVYENRILCRDKNKEASHSCYRGVANLIHFHRRGRVNGLWNVFEPAPTQGGNGISGTVR